MNLFELLEIRRPSVKMSTCDNLMQFQKNVLIPMSVCLILSRLDFMYNHKQFVLSIICLGVVQVVAAGFLHLSL
jgi:hypothetical protein